MSAFLNTDRIRTTHVGSLVRPPALRELLERRRDRVPVDDQEFEGCLTESVAGVVRVQAETGLDIVSDGEFGKEVSWATYVNARIAGLEHRPDLGLNDMPQASFDVRSFPEFWAEYGLSQGFEVNKISGWVCTGPLAYTGQAQLQRDIDNLKAGLEGADGPIGFLPVVAPASVWDVHWQAGPYASEEEFIYAIADVLREEYQQILDNGLILQIDDAFLTSQYDMMVPPGTLEEYRRWARLRIDALNHALRGLPVERIRYHICWGSFNSPHIGDVPARDIIDMILDIDVSGYLIEMGNPRHEHEWRLWEDVTLPEGKVLMPGVISHSTNVVEHPELVAERVVRLAKLVGRERVTASTDCGFAQGPFSGRVHPTIQWAKLRSLVEGAQLASKELWA
jgi:5-methyltetrahydropteroyltriglutamate--homocysteine methyltransferase